MLRTLGAVMVGAMLAAPAAACAGADRGPVAAPPRATSTPAATTPPSGPPKTPTDVVPEWIAGRVTRGGTGPCYGLVTDDGVEYALYSASGIELREGGHARVRIAPLRLRIYCGPGTPASAVEIEPIN